jgi:hypothetical protein
MRSLQVRGRCFRTGLAFFDTSPLAGRSRFSTVVRELPKPICYLRRLTSAR